jgi:hypothetical protein
VSFRKTDAMATFVRLAVRCSERRAAPSASPFPPVSLVGARWVRVCAVLPREKIVPARPDCNTPLVSPPSARRASPLGPYHTRSLNVSPFPRADLPFQSRQPTMAEQQEEQHETLCAVSQLSGSHPTHPRHPARLPVPVPRSPTPCNARPCARTATSSSRAALAR